jgi:outer membrane lipoprotein-sorting protein
MRKVSPLLSSLTRTVEVAMSRSPWIAVTLAVLVAASGCTGLSVLDDGPDGPPEDDVSAALGDLDTLSATQVSSVESNGTTNRTRTELHIAVDEDGVRQISRVVDPEEQAGDVSVVGGEESLFYDASENTVTRVPQTRDAASLADRYDYYASIVAAARNDSTVSLPGQGVSPLPVVPVESAGPAVESDAIDGYEVDYLGTEQVAERRAHGFRMTAVTDAAIDLNRTLWLDAEFYYPLRSEQTIAFGDRTYDVSTHLEDVSFDADLPADTFDWTPPEDATEESVGFDTERFDSLDALVAAAPLSVPDPELPGSYAFESGRVTEGNFTQVSAEYADADGGTLTVSKLVHGGNESTDGPGFDAGENVTVAGQDATYLVTGQSKLVTWRCGDVRHNVLATELDREELLAVAESVACQ